MSWSGRDERCEDLFFVDPTAPGNPTEEGQVRIYSGDLVAYVGGSVKSLTAGAAEGETNTGQNVGTGARVFSDKLGVALRFRSIVAGARMVVTEVGDTIEISSTSLTTDQHRTLRHLIHFIDEGPADGFVSGAFKETLPMASPFPTSVTWYTDSGKGTKIVERLIERSAGAATVITPTPITWIMYDADGSVVAKVIDTITYSGIFEYQRTREIKILSITVNELVTSVDSTTEVAA